MDEISAPNYEFGGFRLDTASQVLISRESEAIALPSRAYETLLHLVERAGELVEKSALMAAVWPRQVVEENKLLYVEAGKKDDSQAHGQTVGPRLDPDGVPTEAVRPIRADGIVIPRPELSLSVGPDPSVYAFERGELRREYLPDSTALSAQPVDAREGPGDVLETA
jgi:hypothetical protein